jgi:Asp/Glu/hydantoin racemase
MKLLLINPNITEALTAAIAAEAELSPPREPRSQR